MAQRRLGFGTPPGAWSEGARDQRWIDVDTMFTELYARGSNAAESFGASPSATASANTIAINAALALGGTVTLTKPGTYFCGASQSVSFNGNTYALCLVIPSNTRFALATGVILQIAPGLTNPVLIQNANANGSGDTNISLEGGQWDGNRANQTRTDGTALCAIMIWFSNVTHLDLRRMWWSNSIAYHSFISSVTTFRIENIRIYDTTPFVNGDGVHMHGNCHDGVVRNISGNTGDDLITIFTHDSAHTYTSVLDSGPVSEILVDGVVGDETVGARVLLDIVDFAAYHMSNVTVRNVSGFYTLGGINVDSDTGFKQGMLIDGVTCSPLPGSAPSLGQITLAHGGDSIHINNVQRYFADSVETNAKLAPINVTSGSWGHVKVTNISVGDLTAAGANIGVVKIASGATVADLSIANYSCGCTVNSNAFVWNVGTIGALKMTNGDSVRLNQLLFNNGTISEGAFISNYRGFNNSGSFILTSGAFTLPQIVLTGVRLSGTQATNGCIRFGGTTGGTLIQMYGCFFNNGGNPNVGRAGSETIRVQSIDTPVPSGILTQAVGDIFLDSSNSNNPYRCSVAPSTFVAL
jgi:hypothetical protein